jgi:DNA-binding MarR family transcriptional regulator
MATAPGSDPKEPKDLRYRRLHFPNAEQLVFDTSQKGFVPLPIIMRKLMRHLATPEFRVLAYLHLRVSKYGICYPTQEEIAYELGLQGNKNLTPHIRKLEAKKLISTKTSMGKKFYLVHDPRHGIQHLVDTNKIGADELEEINHLLIDLGRDIIEKQIEKQEDAPAVAASASGAGVAQP